MRYVTVLALKCNFPAFPKASCFLSYQADGSISLAWHLYWYGSHSSVLVLFEISKSSRALQCSLLFRGMLIAFCNSESGPCSPLWLLPSQLCKLPAGVLILTSPVLCMNFSHRMVPCSSLCSVWDVLTVVAPRGKQEP